MKTKQKQNNTYMNTLKTHTLAKLEIFKLNQQTVSTCVQLSSDLEMPSFLKLQQKLTSEPSEIYNGYILF